MLGWRDYRMIHEITGSRTPKHRVIFKRQQAAISEHPVERCYYLECFSRTESWSSPMRIAKFIFVITLLAFLTVSVFAQERSSGGIKGKVRVETGTPGGVAIIVRRGENEVARGLTDKKGEFV